jgi:tetratricopeptide (TPR) repeat protein
MFTSATGTAPNLVKIADGLMSGLSGFGRLAVVGNVNEELVDKWLSQGIAPAWPVLDVLTREAGIYFDMQFPYYYNRLTWSPDIPLAGYTNGAAPFPKDVAISLGDALSLQSLIKGNLSPLLRHAAVYQVAHSGLSKTIQWLFDLVNAGYCTDPWQVGRLVGFLVNGVGNAGSETEFVKACFPGGEPPTDESAWLTSRATLAWIRPVSAPGQIVSEAIERCLRQANDVRGARNLDEWVQGQAVMYGFFRLTQQFYSDVVMKPSLALRSIMSQLEEIAADAGALYGTWLLEPSYTEMAGYAHSLVRSRTSEEVERFYRERLLVPSCLFDWIKLPENAEELPRQWASLSTVLVGAWCSVSGQRPAGGSSFRSRAFDTAQLLKDDDLNKVLRKAGASDYKKRGALADRFYRLPQLLQFVEGNAVTAEQLRAAVNAAHTSACRRDQRNLIAAARIGIEQGRTDHAERILKDAIDLYPGAGEVLRYYAEFLIMLRRPDAALDFLVRALVANPQDLMAWDMLATNLDSTAEGSEAALTRRILSRLRKSSTKSP